MIFHESSVEYLIYSQKLHLYYYLIFLLFIILLIHICTINLYIIYNILLYVIYHFRPLNSRILIITYLLLFITNCK